MNVLTKTQSLFQDWTPLQVEEDFSIMLRFLAMGWPVLLMLLGES